MAANANADASQLMLELIIDSGPEAFTAGLYQFHSHRGRLAAADAQGGDAAL